MPFTTRLSALAALAVLFQALPATAQALRPAAPPKGSSPAAPEPIIRSMEQLCQIRELELVQFNNSLVERSIALGQEKDPQKQRDILTGIESTRRLIENAELSWQRLSCMGLLHRFTTGPGR